MFRKGPRYTMKTILQAALMLATFGVAAQAPAPRVAQAAALSAPPSATAASAAPQRPASTAFKIVTASERGTYIQIGRDLAKFIAPPARFPGLQQLILRITEKRPQVFRHFIRCHVRFWTEDRELFGWSPEDLIDAIRGDGGIDIVAHAARYRDKERLARVLLGASGVEVYTSRHRPDWAARFRAFAEQHGKLWTASTDDHQRGAYAPPPCRTPAWVMERLLGEALPAACLRADAGDASDVSAAAAS